MIITVHSTYQHKGPVRTLSKLRDAAKIVFKTNPQLHHSAELRIHDK